MIFGYLINGVKKMKFDKIDKKIINVLTNVDEANVAYLILKTFPRETSAVFRRRLDRLEKANIITINTDTIKNYGYSIKLVNKKTKNKQQ